MTDFSVHAEPKYRQQWAELMTPRSTGLIMRTLKSEFKFVSLRSLGDEDSSLCRSTIKVDCVTDHPLSSVTSP